MLTFPSNTPTTLTDQASVTTDIATGIIHMILTSNGTTPTKEQVIAGLDASGSPAIAARSLAVASAGAKIFSIQNLVANTYYLAFFAQGDADVVGAAFTTNDYVAITNGRTNPFGDVIVFDITRNESTIAGDRILIKGIGQYSAIITVNPSDDTLNINLDIGITIGQTIIIDVLGLLILDRDGEPNTIQLGLPVINNSLSVHPSSGQGYASNRFYSSFYNQYQGLLNG